MRAAKESLMAVDNALRYIKDVLENIPPDWLRLTTHRLDIYNEARAKTEFLEQFEALFTEHIATSSALKGLVTAYDYIRLGHPLSSILEWTIAKSNQIQPQNVISFSSTTIGVLAILRKNLLNNVKTQIIYNDFLFEPADVSALRNVYGYQFSLTHISNYCADHSFDGKTVFISESALNHSKSLNSLSVDLSQNFDFYIQIHDRLGSTVIVNKDKNEDFISEIQHVRRRETIAMTPDNCLKALKAITGQNLDQEEKMTSYKNKTIVLDAIKDITGTSTKAIVGSSGLSIQYAILMGLVDHAIQNHQGKAIKIIVPPNCYGGTNDQARRIAACLQNVEVLDLAVDDGHDMVQSVGHILDTLAEVNAVPFIIAEIPTNPRVEVPDLQRLQEVLSKKRITKEGEIAIPPVFILDQTFCPNVHFLGPNDVLSNVQTISYVSGSKFPSGGLCTAGYCVTNDRAEVYVDLIEKHLIICNNQSTELQLEILAAQMPSMTQRIAAAYQNTRAFTDFIKFILPDAKINFVSEDLAKQGFTPSVFSLDLPAKGDTSEEREAYKRSLNHQLISLMISQIPGESKHCVSYGQLKGSYWTVPATSTQGTTKERDKDYIVRVALSPDMNLEKHKQVFSRFVKEL